MFDIRQFDWKRYDFRKYNYSLVVIVVILGLLSVFFIYRAEDTALMKRQLFGLVGCVVIMIVVSLIDYHFICRFAILYYLVGVLLSLATKTPLGTDLGTDARRWVSLGGFNFQPSELCKIVLILALAVFFTRVREKVERFSTLVLAVFIMAPPFLSVLLQPDLSSSLVIVFLFGMMVLAAGISYKILLPILAVGIPAVGAVFWYILQPFQKILTPWQQNRILGFLNPEDYKMSIMWQQNNSVSAIASGKVYGKYILGEESATRVYELVDVRSSDFIFCVIGEEVGFIGSCIVIGLLAIVVIKCFLTAKRANDYTGMLIAIGIASMYMFQIFANIGVATRILPNTGLPLPFMSYGISSMMISMIGIGLVINIGLQKKTNRGLI